ncbi:MAG: transglutaminase, partial [Actinobacteria bacterium]
MTTSLHLGLVAGAATLLAAAPLATIFARWTWLIHCVVVVALVTAAATALRALRAPVWGPPLAALAALVAALTWLFPSGEEFARVLPTAETVRHFATLLSDARQDVHAYGVPVRDVESLLFLTAFSVGAVAVLVDLLSVGLRRPALAGLPMLAIYSVPVAIHPGSVSPVPFVIGAAGFLWLLVADNVDRVRRVWRPVTRDGRGGGVWAPSPPAAAGRRVSGGGGALAG